MFEARRTEQFKRATKKVDQNALDAARDEILADPYNARGSHALSHDWAGFRAADFDAKNRIIYRICEECVKKHQEALHPLDCCSNPDRSTNVVTFVDFGDYHAGAGRRRLRPASYYPTEGD
jgi:hypothetical protein